MPTFIRPAQVDVTEDGGWLATPLAILGACLAIAAVAAFVLGHLVLLTVCAAVFAVVMGAVIVGLRWLASPRRLPANRRMTIPRPAPSMITQTADLRIQAIRVNGEPMITGNRHQGGNRANRLTIGSPAQHLHIHLHGVPAEDIATILRRQESPLTPRCGCLAVSGSGIAFDTSSAAADPKSPRQSPDRQGLYVWCTRGQRTRSTAR